MTDETTPDTTPGTHEFMTLLAKSGFTVQSTGGGCTAWVASIVGGGEIMITALGSSHHHIEDHERFAIGVYNGDGQSIAYALVDAGRRPHALTRFGRSPDPLRTRTGRPVTSGCLHTRSR